FRVLPERLALAGQAGVIAGPQKDEVIDDGRLGFEHHELDVEVARLSHAAAHEQADADLPRLTILANPVGDGHDSESRMVAESQLVDNVLQAPGADFHPVLVANLKESSQAGLKLARGAGKGAVRLQLGASSTDLVLPH